MVMKRVLLSGFLVCLLICLSPLSLQAQQYNNDETYWAGGYEFTFLTYYENKHCAFYCFFAHGERLTVTKAGEVITDISAYLGDDIPLAGIRLDYVPAGDERGFVVLCISIWKTDGDFNVEAQ